MLLGYTQHQAQPILCFALKLTIVVVKATEWWAGLRETLLTPSEDVSLRKSLNVCHFEVLRVLRVRLVLIG